MAAHCRDPVKMSSGPPRCHLGCHFAQLLVICGIFGSRNAYSVFFFASGQQAAIPAGGDPASSCLG